MKHLNPRRWIALLVVLALGHVTADGAAAANGPVAEGGAPNNAIAGETRAPNQSVPVAAVRGLLYARPFILQQPYVYPFLHEQPAITRGFLIVLAVDPEVARPRQVDFPVLYAGDTPVHLTNSGFPGGRIIVIVPDWVDLANAPVFFGSTELPERVDRGRGAREATVALGRAARPFAPQVRAAAFAAGGMALECQGSVELFRAVADLIDRYAPEERELAEIYRTPVVKE